MAILDKKLLLADIEAMLNGYVPADTVRRIQNDIAEAMTRYEVERTAEKDEGADTESEQLLDLFLDAKKIEGKSPATINLYRYTLTRLLEDVKVPYRSMSVYHLRQYMMKEKERGVSMNTIKHNGWTYSSFFGWLHKEGLISSNPTANLGNIKAKPKDEEPFTDDQIQELMNACEDPVEMAIIQFLLSTGCRIAEACSVNIADLDMENRRLKVTGKGDKIRTVYFDEQTENLLNDYLSLRIDSNPALFYSMRNTRYSPHGVRAMLNRIGERAYIDSVHPHRFRHTLATNLINSGMEIQDVSVILGHANINTTMRYVHMSDKNTEKNYRKYTENRKEKKQ